MLRIGAQLILMVIVGVEQRMLKIKSLSKGGEEVAPLAGSLLLGH